MTLVPADRSANRNEIKLRMDHAFMSTGNNKISPTVRGLSSFCCAVLAVSAAGS